VTIENGRIIARPPLDQTADLKDIVKRTTISEEKFYEELATNFSTVVPRLKRFITRLEAIGIAIEFGKGSMILRCPRPDEKKPWNLGTILTSGKVWTEMLNGQADAVGLLHLSHDYLGRLLIGTGGSGQANSQAEWLVCGQRGNLYHNR
jgi:hypothetical protein